MSDLPQISLFGLALPNVCITDLDGVMEGTHSKWGTFMLDEGPFRLKDHSRLEKWADRM